MLKANISIYFLPFAIIVICNTVCTLHSTVEYITRYLYENLQINSYSSAMNSKKLKR
jgi:hypothetical protein